jgi:hypothetical protein
MPSALSLPALGGNVPALALGQLGQGAQLGQVTDYGADSISESLVRRVPVREPTFTSGCVRAFAGKLRLTLPHPASQLSVPGHFGVGEPL